jgi:Protein of unknown function (DUF3105)
VSERVRRLITALLAIILGAGAALLVLIFFNARDDSTFTAAEGPGQALPDQGARHIPESQAGTPKYATDPPASGPHWPEPINVRDRRGLTDDQILHALELGDVILFYGDRKPPKDLVALQRELSGPFDPVLAAAGQQVILVRRPGTKGVLALAWARRLSVPDAEDPRVHEFADFWLGRGANE